jgi:serine phosphatase RsbU (regulator of sigma subunit)
MSYTLSGLHQGQIIEFTLETGRTSIGRGSHNELHLPDRSVSRNHAEILIEEKRILLRDLGSSNGTYVNGSQISSEQELRSGDRIRFGNLELTLSDLTGLSATAQDMSADRKSTQTILADADEISAMERMSWEEASGSSPPDATVAQDLFRAVTDVGQMLMTAGALAQIFDQVLELVARVIPGRRILLLLTESPESPPVVRAARPVASADERLTLSQTILRTVLEEREALLMLDMQSDPRFAQQESIIQQNLRSAMVAPLFDNTQVIGLLYTDSDDPRVRYDRNQLRALTLLANLIAVKITNTRLEHARREKERMDQEMAVAAKVQKRLLPTALPTISGYQLHAHQEPCFEVGGDLYDISCLDDGRLAIVLGDVTGKGMGAALLMSSVVSSLRVLYQECSGPLTVINRIHREVLASSDATHFVTLFFGLLDPKTHRMEYVNAGHNPPLLLEAGRKARNLDATGMPVGLLPGATYEMAEVELSSGAVLCIFSDAFPEAQVEDEFYGDERFFESIIKRSSQPLEEIVDGVQADLSEFLGENSLGDDATLLLLRREG